MEPKRVYIAGPMTGYEDYNYPAFNAAAERWRAAGWHVFNPAEHDQPTAEQEATLTADEIRALYMRMDIGWVMQSDAVALLPGWQASKGANVEVAVARILNLFVFDAETMRLYTETVLEEASRVVGGSRGKDYGHPYDDFSRTAALWSALFGWQVRPEDVPAAMRMVKESRLRNSPRHRDSLVDIGGYARTQEMVWEREWIDTRK